MANLWRSMEIGSDSMTYKVRDNSKSIIIRMVFNDISNLPHWDTRTADINSLVQTLFGYLHQFAAGLIDIANQKCF